MLNINDIKKAYIEDLLHNFPVDILGERSLSIYRKGEINIKNKIAHIEIYDKYIVIALYAGRSPSGRADKVGTLAQSWRDIGNPEFGNRLIEHVKKVCVDENIITSQL
jgi:hypothetical protein